MYAGNCAGADPTLYGSPANAAQLAQVLPGGVVNVNLREPPIALFVKRGGKADSGAIVKLTGTGAGCGALPARTTGSDGFVTDRAFPYGPYSVCVQDTVSGVNYKQTGTVANASPGGVAVAAATFDMSLAPVGTCP